MIGFKFYISLIGKCFSEASTKYSWVATKKNKNYEKLYRLFPVSSMSLLH